MNNSNEQAMRFNDGKPEWSLVHFKSLLPLVRVLEFGAKKYERDNWKKPMPREKILESAMRHLTAMMDGEILDKESNQLHAGHILCNMMFWIYQLDREHEETVEFFERKEQELKQNFEQF